MEHLAAEGTSVVVNYASSKEGAEKIVDEIVKASGRAIAVGSSVSKEADVINIFAEAKKTYGKVDILINNASIVAFSGVEKLSVEDHHRQFDTNVLGVFLATKHVLPLFPQTSGSIVNVSSVASTVAAQFSSVYSGTKGAIDTITKSLARKLSATLFEVVDSFQLGVPT